MAFDANTSLRVVFSQATKGHFLVQSTSLDRAYLIANAVRGYYAAFYGWTYDDYLGIPFLIPMKRIPKAEWDSKRMLRELREFDWSFDALVLNSVNSGAVVDDSSLEGLPEFLTKVIKLDSICTSLNDLQESYLLFNGNMTGDYYHSQWVPERKNRSILKSRQQYHEMRWRYETSFIAAFKGIERLFGDQLKWPALKRCWNRLPQCGLTGTEVYSRYFEHFGDQRRKITYNDLLRHFLELRNATAAHGKKSPPSHLRVVEDSVLEIQYLLTHFIGLAVWGPYPEERDGRH